MSAPPEQVVPPPLRIEFRPHPRPGQGPADGEVFVRPVAEDRRDLARLVLREGVGALRQGQGRPCILVVRPDPTLDDMLAALLVQLRATGQPLPEAFDRFCEYAATARQGLYPGSVPVENSLQGMYQALRWGADLSESQGVRQFLDGWARLAQIILDAAQQKKDPFTESLFAPWDFPKEQALLKHDHDLYLEDREAAARWLVRIPDEGRHARRRPALVLRRPRSKLWKHWARLDPGAPCPGGRPYWPGRPRPEARPRCPGYHFLAVDEGGKGQWVFSTNPVLGVPIGSLRDLLQKAEERRAPDPSRCGTWKALYDNTLVAPPDHGTALPGEEVIRHALRWARAIPVGRSRAAAGLALAALVAVVLGTGWLVQHHGPTAPQPTAREEVRAKVAGQTVARGLRPLSQDSSGYVYGVELHQVPLPSGGKVTVQPDVADARAVLFRVKLALPDRSGVSGGSAVLTVNGRRLPGTLPLQPDPSGTTLGTEEVPGFLHTEENTVEVTLNHDGPPDLVGDLSVEWRQDGNFQPTLYLLAVGITDAGPGHLPLQYPENDARDLVEKLRTQAGPGKAFRRLVLPAEKNGYVVNPGAKDLKARLRWIKNEAQPGSLAVVTISGHGELEDNNSFHIPCSDGNDVSWNDVGDILAGMKCPVVVVLDTCFSGYARVRGPEGLAGAVDPAHLARLPERGTVVISASRAEAAESGTYKHGALSLAILEALQGKYIYERPAEKAALPQQRQGTRFVLTLRDLRNYIEERVPQLPPGGQKPDVKPTDGLDLNDIPIAVRPAAPG